MKFLFLLFPLALSAANVDFESEVLPVLKQNCIACHGKTKPKAGLNLEAPQTILKGGDSGPAAVPGDPEKSLLYISAAHKDPELIMPPKENKVAATALSSDQLALLEKWITQGATGEVSTAAAVNWQPIPNPINAVYAVAVTGDGQYAAAGRANRLHIYRLPISSHDQLVDPVITNSNPGAAHLDTVNALAFNAQGDLLASGGYREIKLWRKIGPTNKAIIETKDIQSVAVMNELMVIATNGVVALWKNGVFDKILTATAEPVQAVAISPGKSQVAAAYANGNLRIWKTEDGSRVSKAVLPTSDITWVDESKIAIGRETVQIVAATNLAVISELKLKQPAVTLQASSGCIQVGFADGTVQKWEITPAKLISEKKLKGIEKSLLAAERNLALAKQDLEHFSAKLKLADTNHASAVARQKKATEANSAALKLFAEKQTALTNIIQAKTNALLEIAKLEAQSRKIVEEYFRAAAANDKEFGKAKAAFENLSKEGIEKTKPLMDAIAQNPKKVAAAEKELKNAELDKDNAGTELELAGAALKESTRLAELAKKQASEAEANLASTQKLQTEETTRAKEKEFHSFAFGLNKIAGLDSAGELHIWSTNGALLEVIAGRSPIAFTGNELLCASSNAVESWNFDTTWKLEKVLGSGDADSPISDRVNALRFSGDGAALISGGGEPSRGGEIQIWNVAKGKMERQYIHVHSDSVLSLSVSPDGKLIASGAADRFAKVTELASGKVLRTLEGHTHHVLGIDWKADGRTIITSGADNVLKVWNAETGERKKNIEGFSKELTSLAFLGLSDRAVTATENQVIMVNERGEKPRYFGGASDFIYSVAATVEGDLIVAGNLQGTLYVWKTDANSPIASFPAK